MFCQLFLQRRNKTSSRVSTSNYCISSQISFAILKMNWGHPVTIEQLLKSHLWGLTPATRLRMIWDQVDLRRPSYYLHVTSGDCQGRLSGWTSDHRDGTRIGTYRIRNIFYQGHQTKPSRICAILLFFFRCVNSFVCLQRADCLETLLTVSEGEEM